MMALLRRRALLLVTAMAVSTAWRAAADGACDWPAARPAPTVTTIVASSTNPASVAWVLHPNCTLDEIEVTGDEDDGVAMLFCTERHIARIESLPTTVERLYFDNNDVTQADLTNYTTLDHIILAWCGLTSADGFRFPTSLRTLDFDGNTLKGIAAGTIPDDVEVVHLAENKLKSLANFSLPSALKELYLTANQFTSINFPIPEGLEKLLMDANSKLTSFENLTMPDSLSIVTCVNCEVQTFRGVQLSPSLQRLDLSGTTITEFEVRESDVDVLTKAQWVGKVSQPTCKDPTARQVEVHPSTTVCVISDTVFEAKYSTRLKPAATSSSGSTLTDSPSTPTEAAITTAPIAETNASSSTSSTTTIIIVAVVAGIVCAAIAIMVYRKCTRKKGEDHPDDDKYHDASTLNLAGSTGATVRSGSSSLFAPHEYLSNDVRNDPTLIMYRIAYNEIHISRLIARGGFGVIYLGQFRGRQVAVKQILPDRTKDMRAVSSFMDEARLCASLEHPHIVEFIGLSWSTLQDVAIVSEYMAGGELHAILRNQQNSDPSEWFLSSADLKAKSLLALDIADAIVYLHSFEQPIVHRDLKARNVLLNCEGDAKLSDFGISREVALDETMTGEIGTVAWIAPEVLRGERYSEKADIYSLGVLLVELDTAQHPYKRQISENTTTPQSNTQIALLVSSGRLVPSVSANCPPDVAALVASCLNFEAQTRPAAMDIHYALQKILHHASPKR